ncbi:hypothetical protein GF342_05630 [Candidatus Woesearchaeota archaeon]|nr:hypothetical protein [Candidatus Woesearchaeota archaeon]
MTDFTIDKEGLSYLVNKGLPDSDDKLLLALEGLFYEWSQGSLTVRLTRPDTLGPAHDRVRDTADLRSRVESVRDKLLPLFSSSGVDPLDRDVCDAVCSGLGLIARYDHLPADADGHPLVSEDTLQELLHGEYDNRAIEEFLMERIALREAIVKKKRELLTKMQAHSGCSEDEARRELLKLERDAGQARMSDFMDSFQLEILSHAQRYKYNARGRVKAIDKQMLEQRVSSINLGALSERPGISEHMNRLEEAVEAVYGDNDTKADPQPGSPGSTPLPPMISVREDEFLKRAPKLGSGGCLPGARLALRAGYCARRLVGGVKLKRSLIAQVEDYRILHLAVSRELDQFRSLPHLDKSLEHHISNQVEGLLQSMEHVLAVLQRKLGMTHLQVEYHIKPQEIEFRAERCNVYTGPHALQNHDFTDERAMEVLRTMHRASQGSVRPEDILSCSSQSDPVGSQHTGPGLVRRAWRRLSGSLDEEAVLADFRDIGVKENPVLLYEDVNCRRITSILHMVGVSLEVTPDNYRQIGPEGLDSEGLADYVGNIAQGIRDSGDEPLTTDYLLDQIFRHAGVRRVVIEDLPRKGIVKKRIDPQSVAQLLFCRDYEPADSQPVMQGEESSPDDTTITTGITNVVHRDSHKRTGSTTSLNLAELSKSGEMLRSAALRMPLRTSADGSGRSRLPVDSIQIDDYDELREFFMVIEDETRQLYLDLARTLDDLESLRAAQPGMIRTSLRYVGALGLALGALWLHGVDYRGQHMIARLPEQGIPLTVNDDLTSQDNGEVLGRSLFDLDAGTPVTADTVLYRLAQSKEWERALSRHDRSIWDFEGSDASVSSSDLSRSPVISRLLTRQDLGYTGSDESAEALLTYLAHAAPFVEARSRERPEPQDVSGFVTVRQLNDIPLVSQEELYYHVQRYLHSDAGREILGRYMTALVESGGSSPAFPKEQYDERVQNSIEQFWRRAFDFSSRFAVTPDRMRRRLSARLLGPSPARSHPKTIYGRITALERRLPLIPEGLSLPRDEPRDPLYWRPEGDPSSRPAEGSLEDLYQRPQGDADPLNWGAEKQKSVRKRRRIG